MKIQIYMTNGLQWALDIGGTRINNYSTLKELFEVLEDILNYTVEKRHRTKKYNKQKKCEDKQ